MKIAQSQFTEDLRDPSAGVESDLYKAISPLISGQDSGKDSSSSKKLREDVRKGLVGLEYLTGLKKNKGETFYDAHPYQAVATDTLKHSAGIGAGVAGLGVLGNLLTQKRNMQKTEPASMAREKNVLDRTHPLESLRSKKDKPIAADIAKIFGEDLESNLEKRLDLIDRLNSASKKPGATFSARHQAETSQRNKLIEEHEKELRDMVSRSGKRFNDPADQQAFTNALKEQRAVREALHKAELAKRDATIKKILDEAHATEGFQGMGKYVDLHHSLADAKRKGGLGKYFGERLNTVGAEGGKLQEFLRKYIAPNQDQAIIDLLEKRNITGAHPHLDKNLVKDIIANHLGIDPNSERMRAIMETGFERLKNQSHQRSGLARSLVRHRAPIAAGAAIGLGGMGLYKLIKAIQDRAYPEDQVKEWKKTLLKSRGDFEAADKIQ
jgi:hypothetical protein